MNQDVWFERFLIAIRSKMISEQTVFKFYVISLFDTFGVFSESKLSKHLKLIYRNRISQFQKHLSFEKIWPICQDKINTSLVFQPFKICTLLNKIF